MKKIFLITLLLIPLISFSQTTKPIEGFLGIKFGSSKLNVFNVLKAKGGTIDKSSSVDDLVSFTNIKLGHRESVALGVRFFNNKLYSGDFIFKADQENETIDYYNQLVSDISDVYGPGKSTKEFSSGFKDGDGHEITAIQNGYADINTVWKASNGNLIEIMITDHLFVSLIYVDNFLQKQADAAQKAKDRSDY